MLGIQNFKNFFFRFLNVFSNIEIFIKKKYVLLNSVQLFRPKLQDQPSTTTSSSGTKKRSPKSSHAQNMGGIPRPQHHPTSGEDYKPPREKRSKEKRSKKSRSDQYQPQSGTEPPGTTGGATATTAIGK